VSAKTDRPQAPVGATSTSGPWPFVTRQTRTQADGSVIVWESRFHRKHHNVLDTGRGSTWWAPGAVGWWVAVLFVVGSACFVTGPLPGYRDAVGVQADNVTYFVGSLFFTSAALLQYLEVVNTPPREPREPRRPLVDPRGVDWWAAVVQLAGTLFFNVSTLAALDASLSTTAVEHHVWRPDALGSICFLIASTLAWAEAGHAWISWHPRALSWRIAAANLAGSVAFGVSAVAAKIVSSNGQPRNAGLADAGTLVGATCFLVGAVLLMPERTQQAASTPSRTTDP
jgi:hypothetical protein